MQGVPGVLGLPPPCAERSHLVLGGGAKYGEGGLFGQRFRETSAGGSSLSMILALCGQAAS